jgi:glycosyltransferase involved in cell wall biosynthesis
VDRLDVHDAVELETAFLPHKDSMRRLARCDLLVLPFDASKESSSAAVRSALASGAPVAVTPVAIFREVDDAVYWFDSVDVTSIVTGIDLLLRDRERRTRYQETALAWLAKHDWDLLARRLKGMLLGLRARAFGLRQIAGDTPRYLTLAETVAAPLKPVVASKPGPAPTATS